MAASALLTGLVQGDRSNLALGTAQDRYTANHVILALEGAGFDDVGVNQVEARRATMEDGTQVPHI